MKIKILLILCLGLSLNAYSQLTAPTLSSPANGLTAYVGSTLNFSWTSVTGATSYDVEFDAGLGYAFLTNVTEVTTSMLLANSNIGPHTWHVRARNATSVGSWSTSRNYTVVGVPATPATIFPQDGSNVQYGTSTTFFWNGVQNAASYQIKFDSEAPVSVSANNYQRTFTSPGLHTWSVQAVNNAGSSDWSAEKSFYVVLGTPNLTSPTNGSTAYVGSTLNFTWSNVAGATSYDVEFDAGLGYASTLNVAAASLSLVLTNASVGQHSWHVRANYNTTKGSWSGNRSYTVIGIPAVPVTTSPVSGSTINYDVATSFNWNPVNNASGYLIQFDNDPAIVVSGTNYSKAFTVIGDHTWKVSATNNAGNSDWSTPKIFTLSLAAPNLTSPANALLTYIGSSLELSWSQVPGATSYDVELDPGLGISTLTNTTNPTLTLALTAANIGTHNWHVRAKNGTTLGPWSATRNFIVAGLPAVPVTIGPPTESQLLNDVVVNFNWNASSNATGYFIQFDNEAPIIVTGTNYSRSFNTLASHTWKVKATNGLGDSDWSTVKTFTIVMGTPSLSNPASGIVLYVGKTVVFDWTAVIGATSYDIEFDAGLGIANTINVTTNSLNQVLAASAIGPHTWHVRGKINAAAGPWSGSRTFTVVGIPAVPVLTNPANGSTFFPNNTINFNWNNVNNASSYKIQFDNEPPITVSGSNSYTRTFETPGDHSWKVLASNNAGDSGWSLTRTFTIGLSAPNLTAPASGTTYYTGATINFTWTAVTGATSYDVEFDAGLGYASIVNVTVPSFNLLLDATDPGPHTWHVRAKFGSVVGGWSGSRSYQVIGIPAVPTLFNPANGYKDLYMLDTNFTWSAVNNASGYKIQFDNENPIIVSGTSYTRSFTTIGDHTWKVQATNTAGSSDWSVPNSFNVDYGIPNLNTPSNNSINYVGATINFSWSAVPGALSYDIEFDNGSPSVTLVNVKTTSLSQVLAAAFTGNHTWHVRAVFASAVGAWSGSRSLSVVGIPAVPTLINPVTGSTIGVSTLTNFTWNAVNGATSYQIQFDSEAPVTVTNTSYTRVFNTIDNHTWKIQASNPAGSSNWSPANTFTVGISGPTLTSPANGSTFFVGSTLNFSWTAIAGATSYDLEIDAGTPASTVTKVTDVNFNQVLTAANSGPHNWHVRANFNATIGSWSSSQSYTVIDKPVVPSAITPASGENILVGASTDFTWNTVPGATGYQIQFDAEEPVTVSGTTYTRTFTSLGNHTWKVLASNTAGSSDWSSNKTFTVAIGAPTLVAPANATTFNEGATINFSWTAVSGATSYDVEIDAGTLGASVKNVTGTTLDLPIGAGNAGQHTWHVKANIGAASGLWSSTRSYVVIGLPTVPVLTKPDDGSIIYLQASTNFTWNSVNGATSYKIQFDNELPVTVSGTSYSRIYASAGNHIWKVQASNAAGDSNWSTARTFMVLSTTASQSKLLSVTPDNSWDFGNVSVNNSNTCTFVLKNSGNIAVTISNLAISGTNADQFSITAPTGYLFDIPAGGSQQVTIQFKPTSSGLKNAFLTITNNSDNASPSRMITLTGTGSTLSSKTLSVDPDGLFDFGIVTVLNGTDKIFNLKNTGTAMISVSGLALTGANSDQFSITSPTGSSFEIPAGGVQQVKIKFKPTSAGSKSASLVISNNSDNASSKTITLNGTGSLLPTKTFTSSPDGFVDFGTMTVNYISEKIVSIKNTGTATINVTNVKLSGSDAGQYSIVDPLTSSFDIPAGGIQQLTIRFSPTSAGLKIASLTITNNSDNAAPSKIFTLNGTGTSLPIKTFSITPDGFFDYGNIILNNSVEKIFTLQNNGTTAMTVTGLSITGTNSDQFVISSPASNTFDIPAGGFVQVTIRFKPTSEGLKVAFLTVSNNSDNAPSKLSTLNGTGVTQIVVTVPSVITNPITSVTSTDAAGGGIVTLDGGAVVSAKGLCWGTSANPTISDSKTTDGTGIGAFTTTISGLTTGTTYHVRAYATNSAGTAYGSDIEFTTTALAIVTTAPASANSSTSATGGGSVTSDKGAAVTAKGLCWGTTANPTTADSKTSDGSGIGSFTSIISGLTTGTTYHVRAYAINSVGTSYGADVIFTTPAIATVTTSPATATSSTTGSGGGNVTNEGGVAVSAKGVCWGTTQNPTIFDSKSNDGTGTGSFTSKLAGLTPGTTYHVRAYATNSVGTAYGADVLFTTPALATVATAPVTSSSATTANSGGNVSADGGAAVTARGICWSTNVNPTTSDSKTTDGNGTGTFTSSMTGLTAGTNYHARAYATNSVGTAYGADVPFVIFTYPSVETVSATASVSPSTTATGKGKVNAEGGTPVTEKGLCWSTAANPTIADSKTSDGTGIGTFTDILTGLTPGTTYHVRAFATNLVGTSYGADIALKTTVNNGVFNISSFYQIYPNPSHGRITVLSSEEIQVDMSIYSLEGALIQKIKLVKKETVLDLNLNKGMYLVELKSARASGSYRLIIL